MFLGSLQNCLAHQTEQEKDFAQQRSFFMEKLEQMDK